MTPTAPGHGTRRPCPAFAASVGAPGGASSIDEGSNATATIDFFNPGGDLTTTIDWGDGSAIETIDFSIFPVTKTHLYPQDGDFPLEICVRGVTVDGPVDLCDTPTLVVDNVLPAVDAGVDRSLVVGGTLVQNRMSFVDPGADAPWTANVDWGDGSPVEPLVVDDATGLITMPVGHLYATAGLYTVTVCVVDDDAPGCDAFDVNVSNNVPPTADAGGPYSVAEGGTVTLDASGSVDSDGTVTTWIWEAADQLVTLTGADTATPDFSAADDGDFDVTLRVCDDLDACSDAVTVTVTVTNEAPVVDAGGDQVVDSGVAAVLVATFTDSGSADTHTASIDWGDGTVETGVVDQVAGTVFGSHVYAAADVYTVTVTVTDDDGDDGFDSFTVSSAGSCVPLVHELTTGDPALDDGALTVGVDALGAFGSAVTFSDARWNPPGPLDEAGTVYSSNIYLEHLGDLLSDCAFGDFEVISQSPSELVTRTDVGDLVIELTQTVTATAEGAALTQTYTLSNVSATDITTSLVRHIDGDLLFDGTLIDGAAASADGSVLYEFDSSDDPNAPSTFVGISGALAGDSVPDRWTIQEFDYRPTITGNGGIPAADDAAVLNDSDGDRIVDTPYDVTLSQQWDVTVAAGASSEFVTVTTFGEQTPNRPPVADPGGPYVVDEGSTVLLDGSGSFDSDGNVVSYLWSPGTDLDDATLVNPTFTGVDDGVVTMSLQVTDDNAAVGAADITVTVANVPPVVAPAGPFAAMVGEVFTLPTSFTDAGTLDTHIATVDWGDGSPITDVGAVPSPFDATHTYTAAGTYTATVTVTDDDGGIGTIDVQVEVSVGNSPPVAVDDFVVTDEDVPVVVAVLANDSDPDGDTFFIMGASTTWGDVQVNTDGTILYTPYPNANGTDSFGYTISDGRGGTDSATVFVTLNDVNDVPVADIVGGSTVVEGSTMVLNGSGSSDVDGSIVAYAWSVSAGAVLDDAGVVSPMLTGVDDATVTVTLTVTDDDGATATTTHEVAVTNAPPVVAPAGPLAATVGEVLTLSTSFTDAGTLDTHVATVDWGDGTPVVDLGAVTSLFDATHTYTAAGTYTATVTVTDDDGGIGTIDVEIQVDASGALASLVLTPTTAVVGPNIWQAFTVEGFDAVGNSLGDRTAEAVFTISPNGRCNLNECRSGTTGLKVVTAAVDTLTATATLDVRARQTISFPTIGRSTMLESPVLVTAEATSGLPVTFTTTTPDVCATGGVNGSSITLIGPGRCTVQADQAGDDTWAPAVSRLRSFTVVTVAQTITFPSLTNVLITESPVLATATASSGLPVTLTTTTPDVCTADGDEITLLDAGRCTVRAEQAGDSAYRPARPVNRSFTVTKLDNTITFPTIGRQTLADSPVTVSATASSGLPVTHTTTTPDVCTADGDAITLLGVGRCTVRAEQAGDAVYESARPVNRSFTVTLPPPEVLTFDVSPTLLSSAGGSVELSGTASSAEECRFTVSPALAGFPLIVPCTGGSASTTATVPENTRANSRTYTFRFAALQSGARTSTADPIAVRVAPASEPVVDLSVSGTVSADPAEIGRTLTYVFTVVNAGPDSASTVDVDTVLPSGAAFVSATATQGTGCTVAFGIASCSLGDLVRGGSAEVTIVVVPNSPGTGSTIASVTSAATDADPANDEARVDTLFFKRYIVYTDDSTGTVRRMEPFTGSIALTTQPGAKSDAVVSPDGQTVAYWRQSPAPSYDSEIWMVDIDGTNERFVATIGVSMVPRVSWSPDSSKIVFSVLTAGKWKATVASALGAPNPQLLIPDTTYGESAPAYSPDGSKIIFRDSCQRPSPAQCRYHLVDADGSGTPVAYTTYGSGGGVVWDPAGEWFYYAVSSTIYRARVDGSLVEPVVTGAYGGSYWSLSPQGDRIAYTDRVSGKNVISVVDVDGSNRQQLTIAYTGPDPAGCYSPVWTPDQSAIVMHCYPGSGAIGIYRVGSNLTAPVAPTGIGGSFRSRNPEYAGNRPTG